MTNKYKKLSAFEYINRFPLAGKAVETKCNATHNAPLLHVYALDDMFLYPSGMVIGKDRIAIKDSIIRDAHINMLLDQMANENEETDYIKLDGEFVSLLGPWSNGFWHWMMEFLHKAIMAEATGFTGQYIVLQEQSAFVFSSLEMLGIKQERILFYDINKTVLITRLFVPERVAVGCDAKYLFLLNRLRTKLLNGISIQNNNLKRIYISRKNAKNGRKIVNETGLLQLLEKYNFEAVFMEQKSLKEQIELMANADWLIGGNGAGIFHCLFMPESSFIIELFSPNYINPCMLSAVELIRHKYFPITSPHIGEYKFGSDIQAPINLIGLTLRNQLQN